MPVPGDPVEAVQRIPHHAVEIDRASTSGHRAGGHQKQVSIISTICPAIP
jgi:hypothetical protein